jgi:hypothetical protein
MPPASAFFVLLLLLRQDLPMYLRLFSNTQFCLNFLTGGDTCQELAPSCQLVKTAFCYILIRH